MATVEQCALAMADLGARLAEVDPDVRRKYQVDRTVSCRLPDLEVVFTARLVDGAITGLTTEPSPRADLRLTTSSDDLLRLTDGTLALGQAWTSGRLKVEASMMDLLKLRAWL